MHEVLGHVGILSNAHQQGVYNAGNVDSAWLTVFDVAKFWRYKVVCSLSWLFADCNSLKRLLLLFSPIIAIVAREHNAPCSAATDRCLRAYCFAARSKT